MMQIQVFLCLLVVVAINCLDPESEDGCHLDPRNNGPAQINNDDAVERTKGQRRRKRDAPWCEEEEWEVTGRSDGCRANPPVSWYKCVNSLCDLPTPADGTMRKCKQDKYTTMFVNLNCTGVSGAQSTDHMMVVRPQACSCYKVTCKKYGGSHDD